LKNIDQNTDYQNFVAEVKARIRKSQYEAMKTVNQEYIKLNWDLGKMIMQKQTENEWGKSAVEQIAKDLQTEFVGMKGFSSRNLWLMRQFYETYHQNTILQPLVAELS
jgi:predicted nuclease of restriction endonuclease-like (RecB) superfamily